MLTTFFEAIRDFRRPQGQKYGLSELLVFTILAILCNAKSYRDIHRFIQTHFDALKADFSLNWKKPPAYTTIRNAIIGIERQELEAAFRAFTQSLLARPAAPAGNSGIAAAGSRQADCYMAIALDGKTLSGSYRFKDQPALHQIFLYEQKQKLILGHVDTDGKGAEMTTVQALLPEIPQPEALFTMDALHCQKKTFARAAAAGHRLLVQVKNNQQQLCKDLGRLAAVEEPTQSHHSALQAGHGCLVERKASVWRNKQLIAATLLDKDWQASH
jgi:hypothetical protein